MTSATASGGQPVAYCTREDVKSVIGFQSTSRQNNRRIDRKILASSRNIEGQLKRFFYPLVDTQTFDWPTHQYAISWRLWLDELELISVSQVLSAGTDITASVLLRPDAGPPFTNLEINLATLSAFDSGQSYQRAISVAGTFGYCDQTRAAGTLADSIGTSDTTMVVSDGDLVGVGSTLLLGTERLLVTDKAVTASGATLTADLSANTGNVIVPISNVALINPGETILVGGERMWVSDVTDTLICRRDSSGSLALAVHSSGDAVYVERLCTVTRGALGTTAASHSAAAPILEHVVPDAVRDWCKGEVAAALLVEMTGYAGAATTTSMSSSNADPANLKPVVGAMLADARRQAIDLYGRQFRVRTADRLI